MTQNIINDAKERMRKSVSSLEGELSRVRAGRAHVSLVDHIMVSCYNSEMPLNQVANINVQDARTLTVTAWDQTLVPQIEKAIQNAGLGLNPVVAGDVMRIPLPELNEERRRELVKLVRNEGEQARVAVRNVRRDAKQSCREQVKEKEISEDEERRAGDQLQKLTDEHITQIEELLKKKEQEMMEV